MGMYTELRINCRLRRDVPAEVIRNLRLLADGEGRGNASLPDHPFFSLPRWTSVMRAGSAYFDDHPSAALVKWNGQWRLLSVANLKNYDNEIAQFIDWLSPFVDAAPGETWAEHRYEEDDVATPIAA